MQKIIIVISFLPTMFFILLPSFCGALLYPEYKPFFYFQLSICIAAIIFTSVYDLRKEDVISTAETRYFDYLIFLTLLFIEISVIGIDNIKTSTNTSYIIPGFIVDLLSPNNIALKLTSISTIFLIYLRLYQKSKEI